MKEKLFVLCLLAALQGWTQDFSGFRTGNYTGVNGVFFNPANSVDSRYRSDVNLLSVNTFAGNNQASFHVKNLIKTFNTDSLQDQVFGKNAGGSNGLINVDIHGPSILFNTRPKSGFALLSRFRATANIDHMDGKLISKILSDKKEDTQLPYTISSGENMRVAVNAWREFGVSYGRVLADKGTNYFKGGITLKYLMGVANGFINIDHFNSTINDDKVLDDYYLSNTTGRIATGFGGIRISDFEVGDFFKRKSTGLGADLGFVYEYRPHYEEYKLNGTQSWRKDQNKYKWKVSVAFLDLGHIRYDKDRKRSGAYDMHVTGNQRFYLSELDSVNIDDYNAYFQSKPQYFTAAGSNTATTYKASLPSTFIADIDYHIYRGFYTSLSAQLPLSSKNNAANSRSFSSYTITPRYEGRGIGFFVPINYNSLTHFNAGLSLRAGPLFIGSGSVLTAVLGQSKQADVHVGLHLGSLQQNLLKRQQQAERKKEKKALKKQKKEEQPTEQPAANPL